MPILAAVGFHKPVKAVAICKFLGVLGGLGVLYLAVIEGYFTVLFGRYFHDAVKCTVKIWLIKCNGIRR